MSTDPMTIAAVTEVYEQFVLRFRNRDVEGVVALYAAQENPICIGTGRDEVRAGGEQIRVQFTRDFEQSRGAQWREKWFSVSAEGPVAWLAAEGVWEIETATGAHLQAPTRFTLVLRLLGSQWRIVQSHTSLPALGQREGESFPERI
jgi:ketosteroid isomerase-like protein